MLLGNGVAVEEYGRKGGVSGKIAERGPLDDVILGVHHKHLSY